MDHGVGTVAGSPVPVTECFTEWILWIWRPVGRRNRGSQVWSPVATGGVVDVRGEWKDGADREGRADRRRERDLVDQYW